MVREHHVTVLLANHVRILCMRLCVSGGSHTQYPYTIGPGAQPRGTPGSCKYFSWCEWKFGEPRKKGGGLACLSAGVSGCEHSAPTPTLCDDRRTWDLNAKAGERDMIFGRILRHSTRHTVNSDMVGKKSTYSRYENFLKMKIKA